MLKKIHIDDLEIGMFVEKYGSGTFREPFSFPNQEITSVEQIESLRVSGATEVFINPEKGACVVVEAEAGKPSTFVAVAPRVAFADEIPVAAKVYTQALKQARQMMVAVRRDGNLGDVAAAEDVVGEVAQSIARNESAAVCLAKLRGRDEYLLRHSVNVCVLAMVYGRHLGLDEAAVLQLGMAGLCHDAGKARLPENIVNKPGELTLWERKVVHSHAVESFRLLQGHPGVAPEVLRAVLEHHERFDGTGYPRGLLGGEMHLYSRILSISDVFDAMTSDRPQAKAKPAAEAFRLMYSRRNKDFEDRCIEHFIKALGIFPVGSFVRLSNGHYAVVSEVNSDFPLKPSVKVVLDAKLRPRRAEVVDLSVTPTSELHERLEIVECLDPRTYKIDVLRLLS
ncbi:metal dependent phosphohydrolase [Desulfovibrio sp. X2]|uniref:HD-GYP domain-containing protein n=1 Tax=Desulfovibrio sp. X2 TaxID=941449 RepID=UPI000358A924|nr:HD-GYP domain-containing protein [Desulfovibrio sp. X2]EPR38667.1 metal dependent phosphohydrolase [Desulfovibrio sp. X2]